MYGFRPPHDEYLRPKKRFACKPESNKSGPGLRVESPDPLVASGDFLAYQCRSGQPGEQAQPGSTVNLPALQNTRKLFPVKHRGLRHDRNTKEILCEENLASIKPCRFQHPLWDIEADP